MNSKLLIRKALSMCLVVATIAAYSMVALASSERVVGELLITGKSTNGTAPLVKVNGEAAETGRSVFSSSTIATPENANAVVNLGKLGKIELAPNTTLTLTFGENGISGNLLAGQVTALNTSGSVTITLPGGKTATLNAGESAAANGNAQTSDDDKKSGGGAWIIWALVLGGAAAGIIIAATTNNNNLQVGGGSTIISPTR